MTMLTWFIGGCVIGLVWVILAHKDTGTDD